MWSAYWHVEERGRERARAQANAVILLKKAVERKGRQRWSERSALEFALLPYVFGIVMSHSDES